MALSYDLISQFAKLAASNKKTNSETTVYGNVEVDADGNKYVRLDGSDQLIPTEQLIQIDSTSANVNEGERVSVTIKNHTATVTGNISSPAARTGDVERIDGEVKQFNTVLTDKIQANEGYFKRIIADEVLLGKLEAAGISVTELLAKEADIDELIAGKATITDLIAKKIDADVVIADQAIIEKLKADEVDVLGLIADKAVIENLIANNANLDSLEAKNAYLKYVNVDYSNIDKAWIEELYAKSGMIEYVTTDGVTSTGEIVGVSISGDLVKANTLVVDKLVIRGTDGQFYKLNTNFAELPGVEPYEEDQIHGSNIIAESITAEKIAVGDLVAFGATIGGFSISRDESVEIPYGSIHSTGKATVDSETPGVYMDSEGQLSVGDANNYLKFYRVVDENGDPDNPTFKLEIRAENILFGPKSKNLASVLTDLTERVKIGTEIASDNGYRVTLNDDTGEYTKTANVIINPSGTVVEGAYTIDGYQVYKTAADDFYCLDEKPCIELSESDSDFKQVITNVETRFMDGPMVKTKIDTDGISSNNITTAGEFRQTNPNIQGQWVWSVRASGNYGLIWKGGGR